MSQKLVNSLADFIVAPSILAADFSNLKQEIEETMAAGASWVHIDVMDGHFVPNLTIGAPVVKSLRILKKAYLDCHLMIEEPEKYINDFIKAGADNITLHIESKGDMKEMLESIQAQGVKAGITMRPGTHLEEIIPYLEQVDLVLVMTVEPGFGGQSFMMDQVAKIEKLNHIREEKNLKFQIQVDGGVNDKTKKELSEADVLVAGSFIFGQKGKYKQAIASLKGKE